MLILITVCLVLLGAPTHARTWIVDQGGDGDFTFVREAVLAAGSGDSILIRPGTYDEFDGFQDPIRLTQGPLTIRGGESYPEETALRLRLHFFHIDGVVENLRVFGTLGSPIISSTGTLIVRNCTFDNNESVFSGGGAIRASGSLIVEDCSFYSNRSTDPRYESDRGGAILGGLYTEIHRCLFIGNESGRLGGAMNTGDLLIEDCVFIGNRSDDGAAISALGLVGMRRCTLILNEVRGGYGSALADNMSDWFGAISHCIIARTINGWGVECDFNAKELECCDVWGNERGDYMGTWCYNLESNGNFSEDPLLCDEETGDVGLLEGSPCLPGQHGGLECGVVGARGLGCVDVPVEALTWGKVRWLFR